MPKTRPPYPEAFRRQIVELARSGISVSELAEKFEPTPPTIRSWIKKANLGASNSCSNASMSAEHEGTELEELRELRRENLRLKLERDVLAKAAAWFAREAGEVPSRPSHSPPFERVDG